MCSLAGRVDTTKKQVTNRRVHTRLFYLGCVKGGMGYWNKIRIDFPEVFRRMAVLEREIGRTVIKGVYLDELEPNRGRNKEIELPSCDVICEMLTKAAIEKRG